MRWERRWGRDGVLGFVRVRRLVEVWSGKVGVGVLGKRIMEGS